MIAVRMRSAIERLGWLRAIVKSRAGQHLVQTVRGARVVRGPLRFVALQAGAVRPAEHVLRRSGLKIFLRHRTRDVHILNEIFGGTGGHNSYEPPPAVAAALSCKPSPRVLDLGANIGLFGAYVLSRWPGAAIRSFEPDPTNLRVINSVIAANALQGRWSVAELAVANEAGEMSFAAGLLADSHLAPGARPAGGREGLAAGIDPGIGMITVATVDLFELDHDVDLMKMDIEGGEWSILGDPRLSELEADALVLEWHAQGCPDADAHASTLALLRGAGYSGIKEVEVGPENGVLWAWREPAPGVRTRELPASRASASP